MTGEERSNEELRRDAAYRFGQLSAHARVLAEENHRPWLSAQVAAAATVLAETSDSLAAVERERDAYKKAKAENDERFMRERDEARSQLADTRAQLDEATDNGRWIKPARAASYWDAIVRRAVKWPGWEPFYSAAGGRPNDDAMVDFLTAEHDRAEAAEARIEAVRAWADDRWRVYPDRLAAALAAPAATPDARVGYSVWLDRHAWGHVIDGLINERQAAQARKAVNSESTSDLRADEIADVIKAISAADPGIAPAATPEPTCEHGKTKAHPWNPEGTYSNGPAQRCPGPAATPAPADCSTCDGSGRVYQEGQVSTPGVGGWLTCPDCGPTPVQRLDDDLSIESDPGVAATPDKPDEAECGNCGEPFPGEHRFEHSGEAGRLTICPRHTAIGSTRQTHAGFIAQCDSCSVADTTTETPEKQR